jgi:hypothetical protein
MSHVFLLKAIPLQWLVLCSLQPKTLNLCSLQQMIKTDFLFSMHYDILMGSGKSCFISKYVSFFVK